MPAPSPLEIVAARLAEYLGPHTARVAIKTFSARKPGAGADPSAPPDAGALLDALRPMLRTLLGRDQAEHVLQGLDRELR
jgi:hypothetical protein